MTLPPSVQAEVKRILDGAARRLLAEQLAEQLERDTVEAAAGRDPHPPTEPTR